MQKQYQEEHVWMFGEAICFSIFIRLILANFEYVSNNFDEITGLMVLIVWILLFRYAKKKTMTMGSGWTALRRHSLYKILLPLIGVWFILAITFNSDLIGYLITLICAGVAFQVDAHKRFSRYSKTDIKYLKTHDWEYCGSILQREKNQT